MLPSKLKALNDYSTDESSDNNGAPVKITKEILATRAELQYNEALQYLAKDKLDEAKSQLSSLLQSEIISSLSINLDQKDKSPQFLLAHLKYCCLTNLGNIFFKEFNYHRALIYYQEALIMDNTDINLWYRIGLSHSKLYQIDKAVSAFLECIKYNSRHWPSLDKLITLLYASNEYIYCIYHISISLKLHPGYLKGHFIKDIIYKKFPSLISYFKSFCSNGGLDIACTEIINADLRSRILNEINDIKANTLLLEKTSDTNKDYKFKLLANYLTFKNWKSLGEWLLSVYDYLFKNYDHSFLYEPIELNCKSLNLNTEKNYIIVDKEYFKNYFEKPAFKNDVTTKRRKSSPTLTDQLKLSRRSARNKSNSKINDSNLLKSVWNILTQNLLNNKNEKLTINSSIKWSDESMDTMDMYRLFEDSVILNDNQTENLIKNNIINEDLQLKQINYDNYFGSDNEIRDLDNFISQNNRKSIYDLLEMFLISIANKWSIVWPNFMVKTYINIFQRVWINTGREQMTYTSDSNFDFNEESYSKIKDEILCIITYGEFISDALFQCKITNKPLDSNFEGNFSFFWIQNIRDVLSILKDDNNIINIRFVWLQMLFNLHNKEISLMYNSLEIQFNV